jgi:drug/metabolite transporter (DMT)-like permease
MTTGTASRLSTPVSVFVIMLCFAANSIITRYLVQGGYIEPFPLTIIRFLSGALMLILLSFAAPGSFTKGKLTRRHIWGGVFLGAYAFAISFGYVFISAAAGALIFYFFVVLSMSTYSVVQEKEPLSAKLVLGQVLGILGVLTITFSRIGFVSSSGVLLMAATGTSWGAYSVYGRRFESSFDYTENSFLVLGVIALVLSAVSLLSFGASTWSSISTNYLLLALFMGMVTTALSYVLWNRVLKRLKSSQGGISQLIAPILTAIMGVVLLGEAVTVSLLLGGSFILVGIYLNNYRR